MASEWLPALFGIIGTLLGGSVTLAANWLTSSTQRYLAAEDRIQKNAGIRREAYALFLASASMVKDRGRELGNAVVAGTSEEEKLASLHKTYYESWEDMKAKRPLVLVAGPDEMSKIADELYESLIGFGDLCDRVYRKKLHGWPSEYDAIIEEVDGKFAEFAKEARGRAMASEPDSITDRRTGFFRRAVGPPADDGADSRLSPVARTAARTGP